MKLKFFLACVLWLAAGLVLADDRPSESDMFGGASTPAPPTGKSKAKTKTAVPEVESPASTPSAGVSEENLQIGGTLSNEADYYLQSGVPFFQNTTSNPNILFLYLDSKLEDDARVFGRIRAFYDPTGISGGTPGVASLTNPYGFGNGLSDNLSVSLQELRISANLAHQVFFTIGRQKVKYGAAHFFNPTDFLNPQPFNFFLPTDERTGVDMIKAHLPSGISNFYAAGIFGNPTTGSQSAGYFREELAYDDVAGDFLGGGEMSFSGYLPKGQTGKAGFDISQALGDFDIYFEGAAGQDANSNWRDAVSAGFTYGFKYGDRDSNTINFDGEYSQAGNLAEFGVFAIQLGAPWGWNDITFVETILFDFNGQSGLSRLDVVCQFTERISGRVYGSAPWGATAGAFYLPGAEGQLGTRLDVNF
jgi:hypothetical protein